MPLPPDNRDPLTGAVTEAALLRFAEAVLELMDRQGPPVGLLRLEIDGLAAIGTHLGLPVQEAVLLGTADRLHEYVRRQDLVGRVGDGFGICMPDLRPAEARAVAERLRRIMAGTPLPTPGGALGITCSIGFALAHAPGAHAPGPHAPSAGSPATGAAALLQAAHLALEAAQRSGGDCVADAESGAADPSGQG